MPATVGNIVGQHGTVVCLGSSLLPDVADMLIASDRSAAAVVDDEGMLLGAITENDIVQAYVEGIEWNYTATAGCVVAGVWLHSEGARCPRSLADALTVRATSSLCEAAERLRVLALGDFACRHLIVRDELGKLRGILSALDLARALCSGGAGMEEVARRIGAATVAEVMKPRAALPTCASGASLGQALRLMVEARQNCVLITDTEFCPGAQGVITPRDALRAFTEHISLDVMVGHWLRGLHSSLQPRIVPSDMRLVHAARIMANHSIHHLVVVSQVTDEIVGVMSSSDLAHAMGSAERVALGYGPRDA